MESLEFYHPEQFTQLTGQQPTQRCSIMLGEHVLFKHATRTISYMFLNILYYYIMWSNANLLLSEYWFSEHTNSNVTRNNILFLEF